ncbi:MBL fold metallo-hydrolase [Bacillus sp. ISL-41]|uniref:YtnP family quorum-quenching lactonase n=1 Tax=Bacillus sp. ISL-41 TaxID=2819127 RepID=UPI001BE8C49A|nr:MBL fold metallo-hydrolase [Bacillus sp. ISL-41]MBT2644013.1 MBL fold metallo-hydrolase [Bacillus sp. ISL-41]
MEKLELRSVKLEWLNGGVTHLDGGAMFGVVPKPLWSRKYEANDKNQIELRTDPILIQAEGKNFLVESGMGNGKLNEKQKRNFGVLEESSLMPELEKRGLKPEDIDYVLMTHMHFDHACGLTMDSSGELVSVFPNAKIITSQVEWDEMRNPNIRSKSTYWKENWQGIEQQVETFEKEWSFGPIKMIHTGGHSDGHSILTIEDEELTVVHMADIMPTHAHQNPLWVMAYDDYPMDSIFAKQKWLEFGISKDAWFTFYHDAVYRAVKFDQDGKITQTIERKK